MSFRVAKEARRINSRFSGVLSPSYTIYWPSADCVGVSMKEMTEQVGQVSERGQLTGH